MTTFQIWLWPTSSLGCLTTNFRLLTLKPQPIRELSSQQPVKQKSLQNLSKKSLWPMCQSCKLAISKTPNLDFRIKNTKWESPCRNNNWSSSSKSRKLWLRRQKSVYWALKASSSSMANNNPPRNLIGDKSHTSNSALGAIVSLS